MNKIISILFLILFFGFGCASYQAKSVYKSDILRIEKLSRNTYVHISYLETDNFGKVGCNGLLVVNKGEVVVFDTPVDNESSLELINWIENDQGNEIVGVVVTHFHIDCLGGLKAFHDASVPSYSNNQTIELLDADELNLPLNGFEGRTELMVGNKPVLIEYFGEGHTKDNVVGYFPSEKVLFGGCLIKSLRAGKGNLNDANIEEWANTVNKIKLAYPDVKTVVPGHGKAGGVELLDFTMEMFGQD